VTQPAVDFYFDFGSPASYLAFHGLQRIAAETGAAIRWRPMLLGGVFKQTGNASPVTVPAKARWMLEDLQRWARRWGVPLRAGMPPASTLPLMRGAIALLDARSFVPYCAAVFDAIWRDGSDLGDPAVLAAVLAHTGWTVEQFGEAIARQHVKDQLIAATQQAVERGVFGAPTCFVGDEMHFGQDRLDFVADALRRARDRG
jgi:2-hydroxychromene-2-carboxylate isomerase